MRVRHALALSAAVLFGNGCAHYPENARMKHYDPQSGYRFSALSHPDNSDSLLVLLAFSGGGTRAAALSCGVLEELARTEILWEGERRRLLDEVDVISSVSGGSFTAAYYALFGDRIFTEFDHKFLNRNIQLQLFWRLCSPVTWVRLASPWFSRSDMAAEFYSQHLFKGKTFGDLIEKDRRPFLSIEATDMSLGGGFEFSQDQFDFLCSDMSTFPVARAVAASAAFPILLSPVTVNNYAGSCEVVEPAWMAAALTNRWERSRRAEKAKQLRSYENGRQRPYLHLLDGGLTDNLGLRGPFEEAIAWGGARNSIQRLKLQPVRKVVIIVVNAASQQDRGWDRSKLPPNIVQVTLALGSVPMSRYSFETLEILKESAKQWETEWNEANRSRQAIAGGAVEAPPQVKFYLIEVSFDALRDEHERAYFENLPTAFDLPPGAGARLKGVAGKLLNQSETYRALLRDLAGVPPQLEGVSK
jgi:NTE family protein